MGRNGPEAQRIALINLEGAGNLLIPESGCLECWQRFSFYR